MLYVLDNKQLIYKKVRWPYLVFFSVMIMGITLGAGTTEDVLLPTEKIPVIMNNKVEFSEHALWTTLNDLNVKFPHIVMAQARVETGHYTSKIFNENNNLFGMKIALQRCTTNHGELNGHANYMTWQESVIDYAMYQTSYLRKATTEEEYFQLLKGYAEDDQYETLVRSQAQEVTVLYKQ